MVKTKEFNTTIASINAKSRINTTMQITVISGYTPIIKDIFPSHIAYLDVASGSIVGDTLYFSVNNTSENDVTNEPIIAFVDYVPNSMIMN